MMHCSMLDCSCAADTIYFSALPTTGRKVDNDIEGLGVVVGFTALSWITIALLIAYYVVGFDPCRDPFSGSAGRAAFQHRENPIDGQLTKLFAPMRVFFAAWLQAQGGTEKLFNKCILRIADTQLITGLAIMISGYSQLCSPDRITIYHWQLVLYLAWFTGLSHLASLNGLRIYFHHRPWARTWRLLLITALQIMIFVAFIPTGHFDLQWMGDIVNCPAACFFNIYMSTSSEWFWTMVFSLLLLVYGYFIRVLKLFRVSSTVLQHRLHTFLDYLNHKILDSSLWLFRHLPSVLALFFAHLLIPLKTGFFFSLRLTLDFFSSLFVEIILLLVSGMWATLRLSRTLNLPSGSHNEENKKWGFGQVMPVVLLTAPLMPVVEAMIRTFLYKDGKLVTVRPASLGRDNLDETTNDLTDQAPLLGIPLPSMDPAPPSESDAEPQNDALLLTSPPIAPQQEFEHEYQTDPVRAEIKRVVDCDQLFSYETMILAKMFPQTGGLICISFLLLPGMLARYLSPGMERSASAIIAFSLVVMPSMCSGYLWISLWYLFFWAKMREGWLKRTIVWFLCLFWTFTYGSLFAAILFQIVELE
uniref:Uncharacterized protein n=1 Tax=Bionectria ochroleuca TaxID=29856 RepID=A0A8H7NIU0_BIOOC